MAKCGRCAAPISDDIAEQTVTIVLEDSAEPPHTTEIPLTYRLCVECKRIPQEELGKELFDLAALTLKMHIDSLSSKPN